MKRTKNQKREIQGYSLHVSTGAEPKVLWTRVGYLFDNREEARNYKDKHFPHAKASKVQAVRLNIQPKSTKETA